MTLLVEDDDRQDKHLARRLQIRAVHAGMFARRQCSEREREKV